MKKILMTGITGLVGQALGRRLTNDKHVLVGLVRDVDRARTQIDFPCELVQWDGRQDVPVRALDGVEVIIHLAGENIATKRWSRKRKQALRDSRIHTLTLLHNAFSIRSRPLELMISASATGYYGDQGDEWLTESSPKGEGFLAQLCEDWEHEAYRLPAKRHLITRFGIVLSERGGFLREVLPKFRRLGASPLGDGRQFVSWIHIEDLVNMLATAVTDTKWHGPINVVSPHPVRNSELTEKMAQVFRLWKMPRIPALMLHFLFGELATALLASSRVAPQKLIDNGWKFKFPEIQGALESLNAPKVSPADFAPIPQSGPKLGS